MTVYSIARDWGPNAPLVRIVTDSSIEEILTGGWLGKQYPDIEKVNNGPFEWDNLDTAFVVIVDANGVAIYSNIYTIFPDRMSLNPISPLNPNLQNIVAHAGGGQALATQLNLGFNVVTVVASPNDSVILPDDVLGQTVTVSNAGANVLAVYPFLGDSINGGATNAPIFIFPGETYLFYGTGTLSWNTVNISPVLTTTDGITAHPGGGQANAVILNVGTSVITTVGTANDSVIIPPNSEGQIFVVFNKTALAMTIYPPLGGNFWRNGQPTADPINGALTLNPKFANLIVGSSPTELLVIV